LQSEEDEVADVEDMFRTALVSLGFHPLLSAEKMLAHSQQHGRENGGSD
jgi:hypothetical protein